MELVDSIQRKKVLDPSNSYIVQAPAGSGKTGLLVQRFLRLLSVVNQPEEILAITFTRKATSEMKERIISTLSNVEHSEFKVYSDLVDLAQKALKNSYKKQWNLLEHQRRLHIQTIDSFCHELVKHMPWAARFGAPPRIVEEAGNLYLEAAKNTLNHIEQQSQWAPDCENLLNWVDARFSVAQGLLSTLLAKRDRWMRGLPTGSREQFESMWQDVIVAELKWIHTRLSLEIKEEITFLARVAAKNLSKVSSAHPLLACLEMYQFPTASIHDLPKWLGITELFVTRHGSLRTVVKETQGIPSANQPLKQKVLSVLNQFREDIALTSAIASIRKLPNGRFEDRQWKTIDSLFRLLPLAAAELRLLFKETNQTDYVELMQRAETALGNTGSPSDLALAFDYRLRHILVDEFQDTSRAQINLLSKLTENWESNDGRSIFLVGDPMQSIYRFREAEISHFLEIQQKGIGQIRPVPITLQTNFRSGSQLVSWFNATFERIFPDQNDTIHSAVQYSPAVSSNSVDQAGIVVLHRDLNRTRDQEAAQIVELIQLEEKSRPTDSIAVLARSRNHLHFIATALRKADIVFQATDIETLEERTVIQDLMAITRGIIQPADRIAWLSILRAPWCGLNLSDLSAITAADVTQPILKLIQQETVIKALSDEGRARVNILLRSLIPAIQTRGRVPLGQCVEAAWFSLAGPTLVAEKYLNDCELFFELLNKLESQFYLITPSILSQAVSRLWSSSKVNTKVELMTIHKAKGLEFDTVIIPGLERIPRSQDRELLRWAQLPNNQQLLALLPASGKEDKFYQFLGNIDKIHQRNELCRLLYVACTRARKRLHLFAGAKEKDNQIASPPSTSFLNLMWPIWHDEFNKELENPCSLDNNPLFKISEIEQSSSGLRRFPLGFCPPYLLEDISIETPKYKSIIVKSMPIKPIEVSSAGNSARVIGIVLHQILQQIDKIGWEKWKKSDHAILFNQAQSALLENGLHQNQVSVAFEQIRSAIRNIQTDPKAEWVFSPEHIEIKTEWPLTGIIRGQIRNVVIDRSFIDKQGYRWIIDFKSSRHEEPDTNTFIAREKLRYQDQLEQYAEVIKYMESCPIRLGLYFPLLKGWVEWSTSSVDG